MDELEVLTYNINLTKFDVDTSHTVDITCIKDPHNFFVRPIQYRSYIRKLEKEKLLLKPSSLNEYDVVMFGIESGKYAKGRICRIHMDGNSQKYDIFALDYGQHHNSVLKEHIWKCNDNVYKIPPLAVCCQLAKCSTPVGENWSDISIEAFKEYASFDRMKVTILDKIDNKLVVELRNSDPQDVASIMALTGFFTTGCVPSTLVKTPTVNPDKMNFKYKNYCLNQTIPVKFLTGKSHKEFYVSETPDLHQLFRVHNDTDRLTENEPKLSVDHFKVNITVCVKNDRDKYDRGIIKEITVPNTEAIVILVDEGTEVRAHVENIRYVPKIWYKKTVRAIYCSTTMDRYKRMELYRNVRPAYTFIIQFKSPGYNFCFSNIVDILPLPGNSSRN